MEYLVIGYFVWHLVGSFQHPYHIIMVCSYTCDIQWKCYSWCILGTFIGAPFCSIALDRIFESSYYMQRHTLKEGKDTHGNNSKNNSIKNNPSTVSDIQYEVVKKNSSRKMCWSMLSFTWISFPWRIQTGPAKRFHVHLAKTLKQFHCSVIPILKSYGFQDSVQTVNILFFQRGRHTSK